MKVILNSPLKTLLTIVAGFTVLSLFKGMHWLVYPALTIGAAGLLSERLCRFIELAWMQLARVLSFIVPNILLTLIFFLVLFPLAVLSKLFKKQDQLLLSNTKNSTFVNVTKTPNRESFEKLW